MLPLVEFINASVKALTTSTDCSSVTLDLGVTEKELETKLTHHVITIGKHLGDTSAGQII